MKKKMLYILLIILIVMFVTFGGLLIKDILRSKREIKANKELSQMVHIAKKEIEDRKKINNESALESVYSETGTLYQYDSVSKKNKDMIGWIYIDGTNIDYPVMYKENEPEYYLRRGFDKEYAYSGSIFTGEGYTEDSNYTIIYGHNMKDDSMFGTLNRYKSKEFAEKHPIINFDTLTQEHQYEIIGAFYSEIYDGNQENVFKYYGYKTLSDSDIFYEFINQVKKYRLYDTEAEAEYGDKILTLSTCSYHKDNGRFVVVAREKKK